MSYILDALKKSEQERNSQPVTHITTPQRRPNEPAPKRKKWVWIVPVLLAGNIALLMWPDSSPSSTTGSATVTESTRQPNQPLATTPVTVIGPEERSLANRSDTPSQEISEKRSITASPHHIMTAQLSDNDPDPEQRYHRNPFAPMPGHPERTDTETLPANEAPLAQPKAPTVTKAAPVITTPDVNQLNRSLLNQALIEQLAPLRQGRPVTSGTDQTPQTVVTQKQVYRSTESDRNPRENSSVVISNSSADNIDSRVPLLSELDAETRNAIPDLKVSVHIFAATPEQRMARVNGKMMHEGQSLNNDLQLNEIKPESLIFSFRGISFQLLR
ncbi:general secretion pathway protein GspB [uncultured Amphritea sp.]|uniref:general secretion pathway protein GspB n=1 Tax=uncultured Amphritea sp. TaxID=981605 RepID=UPI0026145C5A|nr:general secretion pathway protein GspB [uncultured Amphritea sp.]